MAPATVPGTVLNSMIVNGKYPDPFYGRIVTDTIPDTLKDTDYWYRTTFAAPARQPGQRLWLRFGGVNYCAEVWLNGALVGRLEGAFKQGAFDVSRLVPQAGGAATRGARGQAGFLRRAAAAELPERRHAWRAQRRPDRRHAEERADVLLLGGLGLAADDPRSRPASGSR